VATVTVTVEVDDDVIGPVIFDVNENVNDTVDVIAAL
jgi:hypothetical protein